MRFALLARNVKCAALLLQDAALIDNENVGKIRGVMIVFRNDPNSESRTDEEYMKYLANAVRSK